MPRVQKDALALYHALNELVRVYQFRDRDRICCHGISITQCHGLELLVLHGPLMLNELASFLHLDKSTTSRVVSALENKGYATRLVDSGDSRALQLKATRAGVRLHQLIMDEILEEEKHLLGDLPRQVRRALPGVIRQLTHAAESRSMKLGGSCAAGSTKGQSVEAKQ